MRALWNRYKGPAQGTKVQRCVAPRCRQLTSMASSTDNVTKYTQQANSAADGHCMAFQTLADIMNPCSAFWRSSKPNRFRFVLGLAPALGIGKRQVIAILGATVTIFVAIISSLWLF